MTTKNALLKVMRSHCSECMGGPRASEKVWPIPNPGDVEGCTSPECGLYLYRKGEDPAKNPVKSAMAKKRWGERVARDA